MVRKKIAKSNGLIEKFINRYRARKNARVNIKQLSKAPEISDAQLRDLFTTKKIVHPHFGFHGKVKEKNKLNSKNAVCLTGISVTKDDDPGTNSTGPRGPRK